MMNVSVDMRSQFGPVRDQGPRPTCLAFAASSAHEHSLRRPDFLSVDFLYGCGVRRSHKDMDRGISLHAAAEALEADGQPDEIHLPYSLDIRTLPARIASVSAPTFRCRPTFRNATVSEVFALLDSGHSVVLALRISAAFHAPGVNATILTRNPDRDTGAHAVVALGHGARAQERFLLVRNSWGSGWGENGHAWVSESYASGRLLQIGLI